jgi:hypothetical protein
MRRFLGALGIAVALLLMLAGMVWASGPVNQDQPGRPIIVRWSTESEVNTAGFNIYRSASEDGPWTRINPQLIPGSSDPLRGGTYVFTDTNVIAGQSYWYELEEVELGGQVNRLERTQATAGRQGLSLPSGFPCGGALLVLPLFGLVRARVKENRVRRRVR